MNRIPSDFAVQTKCIRIAELPLRGRILLDASLELSADSQFGRDRSLHQLVEQQWSRPSPRKNCTHAEGRDIGDVRDNLVGCDLVMYMQWNVPSIREASLGPQNGIEFRCLVLAVARYGVAALQVEPRYTVRGN